MQEFRLSIRLFGEFMIQSPCGEFHPGTNNSSQITLLVSYLITNKGAEVSKAKLSEALWPEGQIKNQTAALRNLIYRARKDLKILSPSEETEYIGYVNDSYYWNKDIPCTTDIFEFEQLYQQARSEKDPDQAYALYSRMHQLYQGEFLPTLTSVEWVLFQNAYYRNLFIDCTLRMCDYLMVKKDYSALITLCDRSCLMYQEEDRFHRYKLMAYLGLDTPTTALEYYHQTVNFFTQKFGVDISDSLQDVYHEILSRIPSNPVNLEELEEDLSESGKTNQTFYCNFDIFRNFYQLNRRSVRRSHSKHYLLLLSLLEASGNQPDSAVLKDEMAILFELLSTTLRRNDIYTRTSNSQYSVILTVPNEYGSEIAANRIQERYDQRKHHPKIRLTIARKLIE